MSEQIIVTIGREYGSGGHEIGEKIAQQLRLNFYDRNLLDSMFEQEKAEAMEKYEEKAKKPFLTRHVRGYTNSIEENLAALQFDFLKKKAEEGESFVIVGRCAESIFADNPNAVKIFILSDEDAKVQRVMERHNLTSAEDARAKMSKHDHARKRYHNTYATFKWGDSRGYDLCINSAKLGIDGTVAMISHYILNRIEVR